MVKVLVMTEKLRTDAKLGEYIWESESIKTIDHDSPSDRKWLGSHCFWAMRNGRKVTTQPSIS